MGFGRNGKRKLQREEFRIQIKFRIKTSLVAQLIKNPPAMRENWALSLGWEDPLEKGKAPHSSILSWRIPWIVWSMGSQRVRRD